MPNWLRRFIGTARTLNPEEADRIAAAYFAQWHYPAAYRVVRAAELPALKKFYYQPEWNLPRAQTLDDWKEVPLGFGGFFLSLRTGEVEGIGSGATVYAEWYLRARDHLSPDDAPSAQEMAALLARYSSEQIIDMHRELERTRASRDS